MKKVTRKSIVYAKDSPVSAIINSFQRMRHMNQLSRLILKKSFRDFPFSKGFNKCLSLCLLPKNRSGKNLPLISDQSNIIKSRHQVMKIDIRLIVGTINISSKIIIYFNPCKDYFRKVFNIQRIINRIWIK